MPTVVERIRRLEAAAPRSSVYHRADVARFRDYCRGHDEPGPTIAGHFQKLLDAGSGPWNGADVLGPISTRDLLWMRERVRQMQNSG